MKKRNVLNLIKYHVEGRDTLFRQEANEIALFFEKNDDHDLAMYISSLLHTGNNFYPNENDLSLTPTIFKEVDLNKLPSLFLPTKILKDITGVMNAIKNDVGMNKFLLEGMPGTGKTEAVKNIARILSKKLFYIDFSSLIDSKLGKTNKNIINIFEELNLLGKDLQDVIFLFDEIDSIAMNRIDSNDVREMGRVTSTFLREFERLEDNIIIFATTNLKNNFDKAFLRRFNSVINFDSYSKDDIKEIALSILDSEIKKFKNSKINKRIFNKLIDLKLDKEFIYPGDLMNYIRTSLAFSDPKNEYGYLIRICEDVFQTENLKENIKELKESNFTLREIEILTSTSKSTLSRNLREVLNE